MSVSQSYVGFELCGADFDPAAVTARLGIPPTKSWRIGDPKSYGSARKDTCWIWETARGTEPIWIDRLVEEVINMFEARSEAITELKREFRLESTLAIVLYIDRNERESTPALGHDLRTINFLYQTQTTTDVDIYHYNSGKERIPR